MYVTVLVNGRNTLEFLLISVVYCSCMALEKPTAVCMQASCCVTYSQSLVPRHRDARLYSLTSTHVRRSM